MSTFSVLLRVVGGQSESRIIRLIVPAQDQADAECVATKQADMNGLTVQRVVDVVGG